MTVDASIPAGTGTGTGTGAVVASRGDEEGEEGPGNGSFIVLAS